MSIKEARWQEPIELWSDWGKMAGEEVDEILGTIKYRIETPNGMVTMAQNKVEVRTLNMIIPAAAVRCSNVCVCMYVCVCVCVGGPYVHARTPNFVLIAIQEMELASYPTLQMEDQQQFTIRGFI